METPSSSTHTVASLAARSSDIPMWTVFAPASQLLETSSSKALFGEE